MSAGLFQNLPGAHEGGATYGLPSEPWLLPVSDRATVSVAPDQVAETVWKASRRFWIAANTLCAALVLLLSVQVASDWRGSVNNPGTGQIADATPPALPAEKASLSVGR